MRSSKLCTLIIGTTDKNNRELTEHGQKGHRLYLMNVQMKGASSARRRGLWTLRNESIRFSGQVRSHRIEIHTISLGPDNLSVSELVFLSHG